MEVGTLKELGVDVGDVVLYVGDDATLSNAERKITGTHENGNTYDDGQIWGGWQSLSEKGPWKIISRANPKLWRDMTPEEKGALLLAHHENFGSVEFWNEGIWGELHYLGWYDDMAYRIKSQPKVETENILIFNEDGYKIGRGTVITKNGKPDCASIKMEAI